MSNRKKRNILRIVPSWRSLWRRFTRTKLNLAVVGLILLTGVLAYRHIMSTYINPEAYTPLLSVIAKGESHGNYNAHFGNGSNTTVRFTEMSVAQVLEWQDEYVRRGNPSNAVGKYQIIRPTLAGLVQQLEISPEARFDKVLQDRMAIALLERRGARDFIGKKLTREQFAANLAQEWAALPKVIGDNPGESYYASDGLNKSQISVSEVFAALGELERKAAAK